MNMMRIGILAGVALTLAMPAVAKETMTDAQIRQRIIRESLSSYPGNCACPYSTMSNGRSCGGRSAYSKPGGRSPICYDSDITDAQVQAYRKRLGS
ncbi:hypothetical protein ACFSM5_11035 [Lacibacterium aquatile]|uniref:YARHG domain-containing protein n=1 Tax=Lacibacterium aquatile TaxID=1168082 RepID=A0ABW5DSP5_9PROT